MSSKLRPRFSLLSFLLAAVLVCVSVGYWQLRIRNARLEQENTKYLKELGYLKIDNPKMAYIRQIPAYDPLTWKYRVYLPSGKRWMLRTMYGKAPKGELPESGSGNSRNPGEYTATVSLRQIPGRTEWSLQVSVAGPDRSTTVTMLPDEVSDWIGKKEGAVPLAHAVLEDQREVSPDEPVVLLRLMTPGEDGGEMGVAIAFDEH